ncbi:S9 family peptidase [Roseibacterium beibuensis]|uniref:alpha/beta hydrolase family protein n=1 Tax=[Roseibacterium] beibuensis TaxID=1193142 RepID=UPI00217EEDC3|nr:S9 family peptidase [Roseibacterium beibuensis]MCS6626366.1 S9 family peptidase [Roseibacterium beibuensis]
MLNIRSIVAALAACLLLGVAAPARADPLSIADFVEGPTLGSASLSPSGRYLMWIVRTGDESAIHIRDLEEGGVRIIGGASAREHFGGIYVSWIRWKTDDRLLVGMTRLELRRVGGSETGRVRSYVFGQSVLSIARDGSEMVSLKAPGTGDAEPGEVLDTLRDEPDHILMTYRDVWGGLNVARVHILTGEAEKVVDGHTRVLDYITDRTGSVVGRIAYRGSTGRILLMEARNADGGWSEVYRLRRDEVRNLPDYEFLSPTAEPGKIFVSVRPDAAEGESTSGVHVFDFATRTMGPTIWRHERYDVSGIVIDADTSELLAGCYWEDIYRCDFSDRSEDAVMIGIRRFFGEGWSVSVVSQARDGSRWLVHASAPNNPGEYYIFDVDRRHMDFVGSVYPRLAEPLLGSMQRVDYAAHDGQPLFGYLTRPPGAAADASLPLVVMPHGGPEVRDVMTYDQLAQFLATRGYQVFQPNFRGSSGLGKAFAEAGYRQWGGLMQDDVTAGVEHLVAEGLADPGQVCIMGASYGGYAALQGGAAQGDLYRCVISISGPSDLVSIMRWERSQAGADSDRYDYWVKSIGDPRTDRDRMEAASPIRRAADWRPPVLLIHGGEDDVVPVSQSRDMDRALRRAGKDVRLVVLEGEGHSDWSTRNNTILLTEIEAFLGRHLPAARPVTPAVAAAPAAP